MKTRPGRSVGNLMYKTILSNMEKGWGPADRSRASDYERNYEEPTWTCTTIGITTKGFSSLPNDLLTEIVGFVAQTLSALEWRTALYLSWTCRRMRDATMRVPQLWAFVCTEMAFSINVVNFYIQRSRTKGLTILLTDFEEYPEDFFLMITRPKVLNRWERLIVGMRSFSPLTQRSLHRLVSSTNVHWPQLKYLDTTYSEEYSGVRSFIEKINQDSQQLRSVTLDCKSETPLSLPPSVSHLRLTFDFSPFARLTKIGRLLESSPNLQVAEITLFNRSWVSAPNNFSSNLVKLRVHVTRCQNSKSAPFWEKLFFPQLVDLHVSLHHCAETYEMSVADCVLICTSNIFKNSNPLPSLRRLSMDFGDNNSKYGFYRSNSPSILFPGEFLEICPTLEDLEIFCGGDFEASNLPLLRSLRLRGMELESTEWLFQYLASMKQSGMPDTLQELAFLGCSLPDKDLAKLQDYGERVIFVDCPEEDERWRQNLETPLRSIMKAPEQSRRKRHR
ncbi:hypothetical protein SCHPADRAFT_927696 [Schizopora paradoxa]|uniref:F-box domain-containing protein n=1 Tax=Schizopora paradoxa TaxID=27342 RepID=A0A0H2RRN5_9AGAM|nr:hypothetical protein SCHPADRAFT_927696 [Schizopora paradoxa]